MRLGKETLALISPYYVEFNAAGMVLSAGPLARAAARLDQGSAVALENILIVDRPLLQGLDELLSHRSQLLVFRFVGSGIPMRGQILQSDDNYLLISNPWISSDEEYKALPRELLSSVHHEPWSEYFTINQIFRHQTEELEHTIEKLSRSEAQLKSIIDGVVESIVIIDVVGKIAQVNPAFIKMFGYSKAELLGQNISIIMPEPFRSKHDFYLAEYLATGVGKIIGIGRDLNGLRKDGSIVPVHLSVSVATSFGQKYFVGIFDDISVRKQIERLKDDFVSTVSHELKTPLTSVLSSFEFLEELSIKADNPMISKWVELGSRNAKRLKELVTGILSVEKLNSGSFTVTAEKIHVSDLLQKFQDAQIDFLQTIACGVHFANPPGDIEVIVDQQAFSLILVNLLRNAARHARSTAPLQVGIGPGDPTRVTFFVRDFGIGIAPEQQKVIFEKFYRIEDVDARSTSGTGLGLSIARSVVEQMGGKIWLDSRPGNGTTFFFDLTRA